MFRHSLRYAPHSEWDKSIWDQEATCILDNCRIIEIPGMYGGKMEFDEFHRLGILLKAINHGKEKVELYLKLE